MSLEGGDVVETVDVRGIFPPGGSEFFDGSVPLFQKVSPVRQRGGRVELFYECELLLVEADDQRQHRIIHQTGLRIGVYPGQEFRDSGFPVFSDGVVKVDQVLELLQVVEVWSPGVGRRIPGPAGHGVEVEINSVLLHLVDEIFKPVESGFIEPAVLS